MSSVLFALSVFLAFIFPAALILAIRGAIQGNERIGWTFLCCLSFAIIVFTTIMVAGTY